MNREEYIKHSSMTLYNLYLDDITKMNVLKRLEELELKDELGRPLKKGPLAPTIRVLLNLFAAGEITLTPEQIEREYILTTGKNKRSSL